MDIKLIILHCNDAAIETQVSELWHFLKFLGQADRAFQKKVVNFQLSDISDFAFWTPSFTNGKKIEKSFQKYLQLSSLLVKIQAIQRESWQYSFSDRRGVFWGQRPVQNPAVKTKFGQIWFQQGHLNIKWRHNFWSRSHRANYICVNQCFYSLWYRSERSSWVHTFSCNVHIWIQNQLNWYFEDIIQLKPNGTMYAPLCPLERPPLFASFA